MARLDQLRPGDRGILESISGPPALVQRLYEIGMLEGEVVDVLGVAPLGDPIEIQIGQTRLSLRRQEAAAIAVRILD
jgi:ferrous iron transport protein A